MTLPLLAALRQSGYVVTAEGDQLRVSPRGKLTEAECDVVRAAKAQLLALLEEERKAFRQCTMCRSWVNPDLAKDVRTCCPKRACPWGE